MNFRLALLASGVFASLLVVTAQAAAPLPPADPAKGQQIATQVCAACHAADGNSIGAVNPKLAAQGSDYLSKQLHDFKSEAGKEPARKSAVMNGMVAGLSPQDMRDVAAYYATQKLRPSTAKNQDVLELGRKIYRAGIAEKGVAACAGCHGAKGEGIPALYPRLGGQFAEYTHAQLNAWRSGERANDPNKMMRTTAARLSDAEIAAVSEYIAGLR
jgi:cytochrome c553